jgi:hypothetical protein
LKNGVILELVGLLLPASVALDPEANATKNHFFSTAKVDTELNNISILD